MSSLENSYEGFRTHKELWSDPCPEACRCHGSGFALSDVDTWHTCPYHYVAGQRHPEDDYECDDAICTPHDPVTPSISEVLGDDDLPF